MVSIGGKSQALRTLIWFLPLAAAYRRRAAGTANAYTYEASAPANRPESDYTPRLVPVHEAASIPLDAALILWAC